MKKVPPPPKPKKVWTSFVEYAYKNLNRKMKKELIDKWEAKFRYDTRTAITKRIERNSCTVNEVHLVNLFLSENGILEGTVAGWNEYKVENQIAA